MPATLRNAPLRFSSSTGQLACEYCGGSFEVAAIEARYATRQKKADARLARDGADASFTVYTCSSCGAELVCDKTTVIGECPYCGNPAVAPGRLSGSFAPDLVIPFKLDKRAAQEALQRHYKGKLLLPGSLKAGNRIEKIQGVYVPFWLYDARAQGSAVFEGQNSRTFIEGDYRVTETDHYRVEREGCVRFERIPVDGSSKMPDGHMDAIEPFDYSEMVPFSVAYLPGYAADCYDQDTESCRARADGRVRQSVEDVLADTVHGYSAVSTRSCSVEAEWEAARYAMFPVWMLNTTWNGENYLFAMNGQSGRMVGDLPVSKAKLVAWFLGAFVAGLVLAAALVFGLRMFDGRTENVLASVAGGLVVAGAACFALWSQMKSAVEATEASAYVRMETLRLTREIDCFENTTRTEARIERKDS